MWQLNTHRTIYDQLISYSSATNNNTSQGRSWNYRTTSGTPSGMDLVEVYRNLSQSSTPHGMSQHHKSNQILNIYVIHLKSFHRYITQFCTDNIGHQMSLLMYINSYELYYTLRFIFINPNFSSMYYLYYFVSFTNSQSHLYYTILI